MTGCFRPRFCLAEGALMTLCIGCRSRVVRVLVRTTNSVKNARDIKNASREPSWDGFNSEYCVLLVHVFLREHVNTIQSMVVSSPWRCPGSIHNFVLGGQPYKPWMGCRSNAYSFPFRDKNADIIRVQTRSCCVE